MDSCSSSESRPPTQSACTTSSATPAPGLYDVYFTAASRQMPYQRVFTFEAVPETRLNRASR